MNVINKLRAGTLDLDIDMEQIRMMDRRIVLETIGNCRDLGGLTRPAGAEELLRYGAHPGEMTTCGLLSVRPGLLIRSAKLSKASKEDLACLEKEHRLSLVVDLRTDQETEEMPERARVEAAGIEYRHCPILHDAMKGLSHEMESERTLSMIRLPNMAAMYRLVLTDPVCLKNLGEAVRTVMEHDFESGSVLWHCTEGKDRCGILTAVLLAALGFGRKAIMEDYLITNEGSVARAERFYQWYLEAGDGEKIAAFVREMYLAKEEYLNQALDVIFGKEDETGAEDETANDAARDFAVTGLGIDPGTVERFRKRVLE